MATVGDGDCVLSIADKAGFQDYHTVWDDGANANLRKERPNPNQLVKGDVVTVPDAKKKVDDKPVDKTHTYVVKPKKLPQIKVVLIDKEGKPLSGKDWEVTAPVAKKGKTAANGLIEFKEVPPTVTAGTLKVTMRAAAAKAAPPAAPPAITAASAPEYPRPIQDDEFRDPKPAALNPADNVVEWEMKIGSLPSFNHATGVEARLHNLGFLPAPAADAEKTKRAVKIYQRVYLKQKDGSGKPEDIQADLRDRHDNP